MILEVVFFVYKFSNIFIPAMGLIYLGISLFVVLKNINLDIKEGKISSIIGRSGSGKSTLVEMINALNIPSKGEVKINDFIITNKSKRIKNINDLRVNIGLIFQFPEEQFFNMTVYDEISFGMKYFNYKTKDIEKRVKDSLKMVGLNQNYINRNPFTLSNGEKRKSKYQI